MYLLIRIGYKLGFVKVSIVLLQTVCNIYCVNINLTFPLLRYCNCSDNVRLPAEYEKATGDARFTINCWQSLLIDSVLIEVGKKEERHLIHPPPGIGH